MTMTAPVVRLSETPAAIRFTGRRLGADTREVLCRAGPHGGRDRRPGALRGRGERPVSDVRRARVRVRGRVQGVFFRESTRRAALESGVAGEVRNLADGSVEAVFEGDPDAVERLHRLRAHRAAGRAGRGGRGRRRAARGARGFRVA